LRTILELHLDHLAKWVAEANDVASPDNHWARDCRLVTIYIGKESTKIVSPHFHNAIVKIQNEDILLLTPQEAVAVSCLRNDGGEQMAEVDIPGQQEDARSVYNAEINKKGRSEQGKGMDTTIEQTSF
jgi:hypothetical protein